MKPIPFNTEMVRAILDGRKTQTRRVIKRELDDRGLRWCNGWEDWHGRSIKCPYGQPSDLLWVRETWQVRREIEDAMGPVVFHGPYYKTDWENENTGLKWRSPRYMPRWASRITLEITNVRVERVQDIIGDDVWAEGVDNGRANKKMGIRWENAQRMAFEKLWDSINKKRGYGWEQNPWVWVIEFRRV